MRVSLSDCLHTDVHTVNLAWGKLSDRGCRSSQCQSIVSRGPLFSCICTISSLCLCLTWHVGTEGACESSWSFVSLTPFSTVRLTCLSHGQVHTTLEVLSVCVCIEGSGGHVGGWWQNLPCVNEGGGFITSFHKEDARPSKIQKDLQCLGLQTDILNS